MSSGGLTAEPLRGDGSFNWVYLVELLVCGILTIFFLYYFNRLFATVLSYAIRAYTWHQYRVYVDIQSLQISLLAGRVFFRDIRYHGQNQTILVHGGYITWRYWLRKVKKPEFCSNGTTSRKESLCNLASPSHSEMRSRSRSLGKEERGGKESLPDLPCRISIKASGVEVFLYNRSPIYDSIIENIAKAKKRKETSPNTQAQHSNSEGQKSQGSAHGHISPESTHIKPVERATETTYGADGAIGAAALNSDLKPEIPAILGLFPIHIHCNKGAIVVGNENTKAIITAKFDSAWGEFDAGESGPLDIYKQIFRFDFTHPVIQMRPNPDFKGLQLATAANLKKEVNSDIPPDVTEESSKPHKSHRMLLALQNLSPLFRRSFDSIATKNTSGKGPSLIPPPIPGEERWKGLTRYLDDTQHNEHDEWSGIEYANSSTIADCPRLSMTFYWDIPGFVPHDLDQSRLPLDNTDINGTTPPDYGLDLHIHGGTITYGPWADRHRVNFQNFFFPGSYTDVIPAELLHSGDTRVLSVFRMFLSIEEETILRIPVREPSKDWRFKGKAGAFTGDSPDGGKSGDKAKPHAKARIKSIRFKKRDAGLPGPNVRPFAWLDIKIASDTTVNYRMDMVAAKDGYHNKLDVDVPGTEISSSVNHGLLWRAGRLSLDCDLPLPLGWNQLRTWKFNILSNGLHLFILRDHLFLLTDLISDWGAGPPTDYFTFTPFKYLLNVKFDDFRMYLNTNGLNIVNDPSDIDDNNFLIMYGEELEADLTIPLDQFRPLQNEITFDVKGYKFGLDLSTPPRNTIHTFIKANNVADLDSLKLTGSHSYFTETSPSFTDVLNLNIHGTNVRLTLFGFLIEQFMKMRENYFGDDMHFKTLEEFQWLREQGDYQETQDKLEKSSKRSNDLDVILCVSVDNASVLLPSNLYTSDDHVRLDAAFASADLRFTNYYMDLMVDFSPLHASLGKYCTSTETPVESSGETQLFLQSVHIFGHRLFGLPPTEPTYVCNWDFDVGEISGELTTEFLENLGAGIRAFVFTLDDDENGLDIVKAAVIHDITFLRLQAAPMNVALLLGDEALLVRTEPINVEFNDMAGSTFSQRLQVLIPQINVGCVDAKLASRHRLQGGPRHVVETYAYFSTAIRLNMLKRKYDFSEERRKQQNHVLEHDERTHRTPFFLSVDANSKSYSRSTARTEIEIPAMPFPMVPEPVHAGGETGSIRHSITTITTGYLDGTIPSNTHSLSRPSSLDQPPKNDFGNTRSQSRESRMSVQRSEQDRLSQAKEPGGLRAPHSTMAFSSCLNTPYFTLNNVEPDMAEVPPLPDNSTRSHHSDDSTPHFNDVSSKSFDEHLVHTTFIVSVEPGIQILCKPEAVFTVANLLDSLEAKDPEALLDSFQIGVISEILGLRKVKSGKGKFVELNLRIPHASIRFLNSFQSNLEESRGRMEQDQYDFIIKRLRVALRSKTPPQGADWRDTTTLHATLGAFHAIVQGKADKVGNPECLVRLDIVDVLCWLVSADAGLLKLSFKDFEVATTSTRIEYLAPLIHRTTLLAGEFETRIVSVLREHRRRMQYLAYRLTMSGADVPDPVFLTRASYALRASKDHLRNHDSWKIIARFRYIYQCLSDEDKQELRDACADRFTCCPPDGETQIIESWDSWRAWDLSHVKNSFAMRTLFGSIAGFGVEPLHTKNPTSWTIEVRSSSIGLLVDPGPNQSEIRLRTLVVHFASVPPPSPLGLMLLESGVQIKSTTVQVHIGSILLHLNWEIAQLIEDLIKLFQAQGLTSKEDVEHSVNRIHEELDTREAHNVQFVVTTDSGNITLDTINLKCAWKSQGLKLSVVGALGATAPESLSISALLHADAASTDFSSRARRVYSALWVAPNLFISHEKHGNHSTKPVDLKIAGASKEIAMKFEDELPALIEVVDRVVNDELTYIASRLGSPTAAHDCAPEGSTKETKGGMPNITVALLMESYRIDIPLFQSLKYSISGGIGRISARPALDCDFSLKLDYDLGRQNHQILGKTFQKSGNISSWEIPPVNGQLQLVKLVDGSLDIKTVTTMRRVVFEASAIHGLLTAFNRPEIANTLEAMKEDGMILKSHAQEILSSLPGRHHPRRESSPQPTYTVQFILEGTSIIATAPTSLQGSSTANLSASLHCVHVSITNVSEELTALPDPQFKAYLRELCVQLDLLDGHGSKPCGNVRFGASFRGTTPDDNSMPSRRNYQIKSSSLEVNLFADTASTIVDVMNHLQDKLKDLDLSREKKYLRRLQAPKRKTSLLPKEDGVNDDDSSVSSALFRSAFQVELTGIQICWIVGNSVPGSSGMDVEDLVLSFKKIDLSSKRGNAAGLKIEDLRLQMVPLSQDKRQRSMNSALLPEVIFNVVYWSSSADRNFAIYAGGKSLDLQLESRFVVPANILYKSICLSTTKVQAVTASWTKTPTTTGADRRNPFGKKKLGSLLIDANFAGAVVHLHGKRGSGRSGMKPRGLKEGLTTQSGRYGQFVNEGSNSSTMLRAPGVALKVEYKDTDMDSTLNAELRINPSVNTLYPTFVPLVMDISNSIQQVVQNKDEKSISPKEFLEPRVQENLMNEDSIITADPSTILGKTRLNIGVRICRQEFSLSCQPMARVAATMKFNDVYITANSVRSDDQGHFFAVSATCDKLQASVQHVYSRDSTFSFDVDSIILSLMNSKHLSGKSGVSAILRINPVRTQINARQLQDFLLFREIWIPPEARQSPKESTTATTTGPQEYLVQRYQQVAQTTPFRWNATISISDLVVDVDLGQAIGKTSWSITNMWASSRKSSDWESNLCVGVEKIGIDAAGRMSGFVNLSGVKVRTSIKWPSNNEQKQFSPLIQASAGFDHLRVKVAFDYQAFAIADVTSFGFIMYNVHREDSTSADRLVAILDGGRVSVFCTAVSASQGLALLQALERLVQENKAAYDQSLRDIEKYLRRKSSILPSRMGSQQIIAPSPASNEMKAPISLQSDVVVTLKSLRVGIFPGSFFDKAVFLLDASDAQARFAVALKENKIHSGLGLTLGQLSIALASISNPKTAKTLGDVTVEDVVLNAAAAKGGTILRVPKVIASMQTWQAPDTNHIDYIFKSSFEGKVDVGWNYSRISTIRSMWSTHSHTLASRLGKPLPESAVKIRTSEDKDGGDLTKQPSLEKNKITAEVKLPQSKYEYLALEPPVIETPQLRDMGEATPPLEWIGLQRDRLPNVTHQIVIVSLLEVAKEVEDAYGKILGSSRG
ncbi:hypothetical protein M501DRAFT_995767 [Patellaria atrata CBS 101060]|uniref:Fermentation associated protein n=1 Tax=Patellaria atrata CBS 101060 TaxID=1346257 RepID=A0A9P4VN04_9PEZI|nr:hypothetical protein M501DRAFT_995767 [Patellaria atrata CBS 101060]